MLVVEKAGFQIDRERAGVWNDVFRASPIPGLTFPNLKRANETPHIFQSAKLSPNSNAEGGREKRSIQIAVAPTPNKKIASGSERDFISQRLLNHKDFVASSSVADHPMVQFAKVLFSLEITG